MRRSISTIIVIASILSPSAGRAQHRSETVRYKGVIGDTNVDCTGRWGEESLGGGCFALHTSSRPRTASIVVDDDSGLPVGAFYQIDNADGTWLQGNFCKEILDLRVPADAERLTVFIYEALGGIDETDLLATYAGFYPVGGGCLSRYGSPGAGTAGRITVTYTYPS